MTWISLKTWNSGDLLSVADLNNSIGQSGDTDWVKGDPQWTPLNLLNGSPFDSTEATYNFPCWRREGNWIRMRGLANLFLTAGAQGPSLCVLPYAARPQWIVVGSICAAYQTAGNGGHASSQYFIGPDGNFYPYWPVYPAGAVSNTFWFNLDGVMYSTAP